jgi:hypothetical protein
VHATVANFALFGLLFAVPQFFQSVNGESPLGSGVRLLPMIGGMLLGTQTGGAVAKRFGVRVVAAGGFVLAAAALGFAANERTTIALITRILAGRTGRPNDDYQLALVAASIVAVLFTATRRWAAEQGATPLAALIDHALTTVEPILATL